MNIKKYFKQESLPFRANHHDINAVQQLEKQLITLVPNRPRDYIVVCIGTDRSTGDALGPLTGTFLSEMKPKHLSVYGTLHEPIHAMNLHDSINEIKAKHRHPFMIAVDACLGRRSSIGQLILDNGPLKPGAAFNKKLEPIGDLQLTGVVNMSGFMEHTILQNTRLSLVTDMAKQLAHLINHLDQQLTYQYSLPLASLKKEESM
jgi:putative sporulation protein YyaC